MKKILSALVLAAIVTATVAQAAPPVQNISAYRHGNLAAAQSLSAQAFDYLTAAQVANNYDLSLNRYKEISHEEVEHRSPLEIIADIEALEGKIQFGISALKAVLQ